MGWADFGVGKWSEGVLVCDHKAVFNLIRGSIVVSDTPQRYQQFVPQTVEIEPTTSRCHSRFLLNSDKEEPPKFASLVGTKVYSFSW